MEKIKASAVSCFLLAFLLTSPALRAGDNFIWLNGGLGVSSFKSQEEYSISMDDSPDNAVCLGISYQTGGSILSIRAVRSLEYIWSNVHPNGGIMDLGILYGRTLISSKIQVSISGGLAVVREIRRGEKLIKQGKSFPYHDYHEKHVTSTFGIPIESQIFLRASRFFGVGIYGFANINAHKTFAGANVAIQLGKLRD